MIPYSFAVFRFWGIWPSVDWSPGWKTFLYNAYTSLMLILVYTNTFSQVIDLLLTFKSPLHFISSAFILLSTIGAGIKAAHCLYIRKRLIKLLQRLETYPFKPRDAEEIKIQCNFIHHLKIMNLYYILLYICTISALTIVSILRDAPKHQLYYRAWLPFNYSSSSKFWPAYMHQVIAHGFDACMHAAYDTLAPGIMIQTCAQFAILDHRFQLLSRLQHTGENDTALNQDKQIATMEFKKLAECVEHHLQIFELAKENNAIFGTSIFLQYSLSSVIICMTVLRLSQVTSFHPNLISVILYLICMISQVFMPCYSGNEITLQSLKISDAIFRMDWPILTTATKKNLILIMHRSQKPVKFTSANMMTLSLYSFNSLIKLSYSVFNVLHGSTAL